MAALDAFVRARAEELSAIPPVDQEELRAALDAAMEKRAKPDDGVVRLALSSSGGTAA